MKIAIVGASSAIAIEWLKLRMDESVDQLLLVGRDENRLEAQKKDLQIRHPKAEVTTKKCDFSSPDSLRSVALQISCTQRDGIILIAHGSLHDSNTHVEDTIWVNATSSVILLETLCSRLEESNTKIVVLSSVAGDLGRKSNYQYGAAKALLSTYIEGMQHSLANSNLSILCVKPGPVDTPMTQKLPSKPAMISSTKVVAYQIQQGIEQGSRVIYTPKRWRIVMLILKFLPFFIYKRLNI